VNNKIETSNDTGEIKVHVDESKQLVKAYK
jgi:hypothetical protein